MPDSLIQGEQRASRLTSPASEQALVASAHNLRNTKGVEEFVRHVLGNPSQPTRPSEIPPLSDNQVDALAAAYLNIANPSEKFGLLWALAFSQNDRAFDTLRFSMQEEFSGAVLTRKDNGTQMWITPLIGVLARHSDRAWEFLWNMTNPDNWARVEVWSEDYLTEQYKSEAESKALVRSTLQSTVFSALGASGRPEFAAWTESLLTEEPSVYVRSAAVSIRQGVFRASEISQSGFDHFYDNILFDVQTGGSFYVRWCQTAEGARWAKWRSEQAAASAVSHESRLGSSDSAPR